MNVLTIAANIAAEFDDLTAPSGEPDIALATHLLPQALSDLPAVLVFPPEAEWDSRNGLRSGLLRFPVRFYHNQSTDLSTTVASLYAWLPVLVAALDGAVQLGQSSAGVAVSGVGASEVGTITYAGAQYGGIELSVGVRIVEAVTYTA